MTGYWHWHDLSGYSPQRRYHLTLLTAPTEFPVSIDEMREHLRYPSTDQDTVIDACIEAATARLDGWQGELGRALMPQTWQMHLYRFPHTKIRIPLRPLISVNAIDYVDVNEAEQTVTYTDYTVDVARQRITHDSDWPQGTEVIVEFEAGYADAASVPAPIRQAIKLTAADFFRQRESFEIGSTAVPVPMSATADRLIAPFRTMLIG